MDQQMLNYILADHVKEIIMAKLSKIIMMLICLVLGVFIGVSIKTIAAQMDEKTGKVHESQRNLEISLKMINKAISTYLGTSRGVR